MDIFSPQELADDVLEAQGINPKQIYNDRGGLKRASLSAIVSLPKTVSNVVRDAAYWTIKSLEKSGNKNINRNVELNVTNAVANSIMYELEETPGIDDTMVKWLPSSAATPDLGHMRYYGKTMTLERAQSLEFGINGCKCSLQMLDNSESVTNTINNFLGS